MLVCRIATLASLDKPRDLRSVGRAAGVILRSFTYLRSDPSTLAARQSDPFAGIRKRRQPWPTQAQRVPVSRPKTHLASATEGVRASSRGGEHEDLRGRLARIPVHVPLARRCSAHAARRSNSPGSFPPPRRALPSAPSSPRKRRRPRKGYAERVDRRHGSLASSHGRIEPGRARPRTLAVSASAPDSRPRAGWKHSERENEVARSPVSSGWCKSPGRHALRKQ